MLCKIKKRQKAERETGIWFLFFDAQARIWKFTTDDYKKIIFVLTCFLGDDIIQIQVV